ncbi:N-acyl-D-amino-acid deacylase family protein [Nocardia arthritidis]|uniref:Amidohydrolase family protein n=1 Tax=Nocardia arthritidis TaxID=228602 RepID=A0A6G9YF98_9NOCA|nr:amidohydrolase family protein [Nocardia arthritidis]QIS11899.1 amidohydrolase family protein [Nocardia arthritidis]
MTRYDVVIRGGSVFDGSGARPRTADVGIADGRVAAVATGLPDGARTIDAAGKWVIPGMLDVHTHYDAEVLGNPGLGESVRHGVTTVVIGNCSLSTVYSGAEDCADMFARVEALPWDAVHSAVKEHRDWDDPRSYVRSLAGRPLGANIAALLGHSDIRVAVMGLARAVDAQTRPTPAELNRMRHMLTEALDAGFLGLSTIRSSFSKLEGSRFPARQLPSTYATWAEYRALNNILRQRNRIHQSTPNLTARAEIARYFAQSAGRLRKPLKTTLIAGMDVKADRTTARAATIAARIANTVGAAQFRWQHLPVPFELYADGVDLVVFEEFGSGSAALNIRDVMKRGELLADETYRRQFRKDLAKRFGPRVWHRDLYDAQIVACPDADVIGKSFGQVADERGIHPADALLDLTVAHGKALRWRTVIANDREAVLDELQRSPVMQVGFADSGAHLRNMAFYNFGLRMLERVHRRGFMPVETAVHRLTGELADWYGLDAGRLAEGARADIAVLDPAGFDGASAEYAEAPVPGIDGLSRMVNRNDRAVAATLVGGHILYEYGEFAPGFGTTLHAGSFLAAR